MKTQRQAIPICPSGRWFVWLVIVAIGHSLPASAEVVTIWEDQFTSISEGWEIPDEATLVSQASPAEVTGSEDGFEGVFTNTSGTARYAVLTIPAGLVQVGDRLEYSIRADFFDRFAGDRINLVAEVGDAFDSGFVAHDSSGGLTFQKEPGTLFDLFDTTLMKALRPADNLYFGNNGFGGAGVESIFYVDYIRIVGERSGVPGDYNGNNVVDAADYVVWRDGGPLLNEGVTTGSVTPEDYDFWKSQFGAPAGGGSVSSESAVPEPATACLAIMGFVTFYSHFRRSTGIAWVYLAAIMSRGARLTWRE